MSLFFIIGRSILSVLLVMKRHKRLRLTNKTDKINKEKKIKYRECQGIQPFIPCREKK